MPGPHQIRPHVLSGTEQIPGSLIRPAGIQYWGCLSQLGQPGQMIGVTGIDLDSVSGGAFAAWTVPRHALDAGGKQKPGQTESSGPCFVHNQDRTLQPTRRPLHRWLQDSGAGSRPSRGRSLSPSRCVYGHPNRRKYAYS